MADLEIFHCKYLINQIWHKQWFEDKKTKHSYVDIFTKKLDHKCNIPSFVTSTFILLFIWHYQTSTLP